VVPGSNTLSPVTVVADVAVNNASVQEIGAVVAIGSFNSRVPKVIKNKKLPAMTIGGETLTCFFLDGFTMALPKDKSEIIANCMPVF